jgi:SAM-dependent methyltransferase
MKKKRSGSLEYRRNQEQIREGSVSEKYLRILPHVPGKRILEIGSAEGVLALLMAEHKDRVIALERNRSRHEEAIDLRKTWKARGLEVDNCEMIHGDIRKRFDLLQEVDTVVAVRCIYYFKEHIQAIFEQIAMSVPHVLLCGNRNRAERFDASGGLDPSSKLGEYERYSGERGMREILEEHRYEIVDVVPQGDPIVVGWRAIPER